MLAHDRALVLYPDPRLATRSQYWLLAVMIGFTCLALWLLSQANVMTPLAHAGHYVTWIAIVVPPLLVAGWILALHLRQRRRPPGT